MVPVVDGNQGREARLVIVVLLPLVVVKVDGEVEEKVVVVIVVAVEEIVEDGVEEVDQEMLLHLPLFDVVKDGEGMEEEVVVMEEVIGVEVDEMRHHPLVPAIVLLRWVVEVEIEMEIDEVVLLMAIVVIVVVMDEEGEGEVDEEVKMVEVDGEVGNHQKNQGKQGEMVVHHGGSNRIFYPRCRM